MLAALIAAAALAACSSDKSTGPSGAALDSYIAAVASSDGSVNATFHSGSKPQAGSSNAPQITFPAAFIVGGTAYVQIVAGTAFSDVVIAIDGVDGYYTLHLPTSTLAALVGVTLAQDLPQTSFTLLIGVGSSSSLASAYFSGLTQPTTVGTGDVQVSVSWNTLSDVDLHVVDPSGNEVYYGNTTVPSGGTLDLDSNAGCAIDGVNNENITWPTGQAPTGTYTVRVDYWSSCNQTGTSYTVTVNRKGRAPSVFHGTLSGDGDHGGLGAGTTITTFSVP